MLQQTLPPDSHCLSQSGQAVARPPHFGRWSRATRPLDGKALRRSGSRKNGLKMLDKVGAWATENGLILGQTVVDDKSNEITTILQLLEMLSIKNSSITIDAAGCQKHIARVARIASSRGPQARFLIDARSGVSCAAHPA